MYADKGEAQAVSFNAAGQVIGQINEVESAKNVVFKLVSEYVDTLEKMNASMPQID
jgi:NAD(P)H-dependent flavin oxidoreductase YrpB (nitropropane dioxygenase family)